MCAKVVYNNDTTYKAEKIQQTVYTQLRWLFYQNISGTRFDTADHYTSPIYILLKSHYAIRDNSIHGEACRTVMKYVRWYIHSLSLTLSPSLSTFALSHEGIINIDNLIQYSYNKASDITTELWPVLLYISRFFLWLSNLYNFDNSWNFSVAWDLSFPVTLSGCTFNEIL